MDPGWIILGNLLVLLAVSLAALVWLWADTDNFNRLITDYEAAHARRIATEAILAQRVAAELEKDRVCGN